LQAPSFVMISKSQSKFLSSILNLKGVKVISYRHHQNIGLTLYLEAEDPESICPRCGFKSQNLHQNHRYLVKDLPLSDRPVYLQVNRRQFKCKKCRKPFSENLNFVDKRRTYTKRLARYITRQVLEQDIDFVAKLNCLTNEEIKAMLRDVSKERR
jgi:transposase